MILPDINILLPAFRPELEKHDAAHSWLGALLDDERPIALADVVASGLVRIVTNRKIFADPATPEAAVGFIDAIRERRSVVHVSAGFRHWQLMREAIFESRAIADLVSDAHLAALAVEHGCRIATRDRDFARFPGVEWFDPLD